MALQSDFTLDGAKCLPKAGSKETEDFNLHLMDIMNAGPKWYEVGAVKYRQMRRDGQTPLPARTVLEEGKDITIPSRDKGRDIPCRVFTPAQGQPKGVYMHIHGGGWCLQSEKDQDPLLKFTADAAQVIVISVGYRLGPEDPYPAANHDCYDAGEWIVDNAKSQYGAELLFMGGESAGGHLTAVTYLHLLKARPKFAFRGLLFSYGAYELSHFFPAAHHYPRLLVIDYDIMSRYLEAWLPNTTEAQRRDPSISPFYANLPELAKQTPTGRHPPALFHVGSEDPLLDDTIMFSAKWMMSGSEAIVKIYPGAPHGYTLFPPDAVHASAQAREDMKSFMLAKMD